MAARNLLLREIPEKAAGLDRRAGKRGLIGTDGFARLFKELCKDPRHLGYRLSGRYRQPLDDGFFRDLEQTAEAGRCVDFLVGAYSLKDVERIARRAPKLRIILDHFGNLRLDGKPLDPVWVADYRAVANQLNVVCKRSALYGHFETQPAPRELAPYLSLGMQ